MRAQSTLAGTATVSHSVSGVVSASVSKNRTSTAAAAPRVHTLPSMLPCSSPSAAVTATQFCTTSVVADTSTAYDPVRTAPPSSTEAPSLSVHPDVSLSKSSTAGVAGTVRVPPAVTTSA